MKKFFAILAVFSLIPLNATFAAGSHVTDGTFTGDVEKLCLFQTGLEDGDLTFSGEVDDGFQDSFTGGDSLTYQSNTNCRGTVETASTLNGADGGPPPVCEIFVGNQNFGASEDVGYTPAPTGADIKFSYSNGGKPLPAGNYSVTCTVTISEL